jgi:hypothetical protein
MRKPNIQYLSVIFYSSILLAGSSAIFLAANGTGEESIRFLIRWTAKGSVTLFSIAFGISSLQHLMEHPWLAVINKNRPHIGIAFGTFHTFHLFFLIWLQNAIHPVFTLAKTSSLIGGGLAYMFMYLMMLTTFPYFKSKISPALWRGLHLIGGYWIWIIFFRSYFKQVLYQERGHILLTVLVFVFLARMVKLLFRKK